MKRNRFIVIFGFCTIFFGMSFYLGYKLMDLSLSNERVVKEQNHYEERGIDIIKEENRISPNTFIEERIHHKECGHLITNSELASDEIVNLTRDEYEEYLNTTFPYLRLISFSNIKVVVYGEKNYLCQDHFIVGEYNGYLAIFNIDANGERILYKTFMDYPLTLLIGIDQDKLREGIIVDTEEELSEILENFIS